MSVFGASALSQTAAAGAPAAVLETEEAPSGSSATGANSADTATTTTPSGIEPITSGASLTPEPANAIPEPAEAIDDTLIVEAPPEEPEPAPELQATNNNPRPQGAEQSSHDGNSPVEQLPATVTE